MPKVKRFLPSSTLGIYIKRYRKKVQVNTWIFTFLVFTNSVITLFALNFLNFFSDFADLGVAEM